VNYITDMQGYVGTFGSNSTRNFFEEEAQKHKLEHLTTWIESGITIDLAAIISEIRSVEWPKIDGVNEVAGNIVEALLKARGGIVFLEE
jgi:hypothetical protein